MKDSDTPALPVTLKLLHHETFPGMRRRFIGIKNTSDEQTHYFFLFPSSFYVLFSFCLCYCFILYIKIKKNI